MNDKKRLAEMRARVIERSIAIESMISVVITYHYFGEFNVKFIIEVLSDENFTSGLKIRILKKILSKEENSNIEQKLRRVMNIRNVFAHSNSKIYNGSEWVVIDPKEFEEGYDSESGKIKGVDFEELFKEFEDKEKDITEFLKELILKAGEKENDK